MEKKFARSTNFSSKEEALLISFVKKYRNDIECKKSDTNTNKIKKQAWEKIEREFNIVSGQTYRTAQVLHNKYDNIKKRTKQKVADIKKDVFGTGGGPSENVKLTGVEKDMEDIIGTQLTGLPSEFDSDISPKPIYCTDSQPECVEVCYELPIIEQAAAQAEPIINLKDIEVVATTSSAVQANESSTIQLCNEESNWAKYTPDMLQTPVSNQLKASQRRHENGELSNKIEKWAAEKAELASIQKECFLNEHNLKIKHLEEEHRLRQKLQLEEYQFRKVLMQEEHKLKLEILELEKRKFL